MQPHVITSRQPDEATLEQCKQFAAVALATPGEVAQTWVSALREAGIKAIDLSGAHRLVDGIHYGLPELFGLPPRDADVVANPGCYPTASLMVLKPLLDLGLIEPTPIGIEGKSGTSGAGKGLRDDLHFSELFANFFPYNVGRHRHVPEIERYLGTEVSFVTALLPLIRGLLVTAFVRPKAEPAALTKGLREYYAEHPYVSVLDEAGPGLGVRHLVGTHQAVLGVGPVARGDCLPVFGCIDNLMRGAASQALVNLNGWFGLDPHLGLPEPLAQAPSGTPGMNRMLP